MLRRTLAALVLLLLAAVAARADVNDGARLFGQQAVDDANVVTAQMERQYGKQLVIETFPAVPAERRAAALADKAGYFKAWMTERARSLKVNGVYVLVCLDPKYVEVGAGTQTRQRGIFTAADIDALRKQLQSGFQAKQYDAALGSAVEMVAQAYADHIAGATPLGGTRATTGPATQPATVPAEPPAH